MFYQAFAGVPEWAPPQENHILYSEGILRNVQYNKEQVKYSATTENGIQYLRLAFKPAKVTIDGEVISRSNSLNPDSYMLKNLGKGDYAVTIRNKNRCDVVISG
jgi:hypothetical protein